ncbi:NHL repeat-containing protein 3-like [Acipenser oxyrinchus oxyrinchus]|uniref:NHL repeat-containing protein 3 n=1 Tax=Acipenser oxyrinchus oxyrinchus TaxID=40147 RepID=A0AAD8DF49_ACIOX|nr:NHL repeat-containing protein 3-like [Acipenser oxyrinchus oxyrinchus]
MTKKITKFMMPVIFFLLLVVAIYFSSDQQFCDAARDHGLNPKPFYKLDVSWPNFPELFTGQVFAVAVNPVNGVIYVAQRGDNVPKVLVFTREGYFLQAWNTSSIEMPHGIFIANASSNPSIWITDVGNGKYGHTIKQYTPSGELIQVLGSAGKAGTDVNPLQFDQPAEIFVHSSGEVYIVDGDGGLNNRLIKLSKDLEVVWMHGEKGTGPAQFYIPHSVAVDSFERVWVADRGNKRIQAFNAVTGDWLGSWSSCFDNAPYSVRLTPDQKYFIVAQLNINQITILEAPPVGAIGYCKIVSVIQLGEDVKPHLVELDLKTGDLYVAEIGAQQAQKFIPIYT